MSDLFDRVINDQNGLQSLLAKLPGFKGYTERMNRREADKMIRDNLADRFEEQWKRISQVQRDMISQGGLEGITELESSSLKLRQFMDRTRHASYGYAGFFDAIKINEDELAKVYQFDLAMLFGTTTDSPTAKIFTVLSYAFGNGEDNEFSAPVSTRNR